MSRPRARVAPLTLVVGLATFCVCVCTLAVTAVVLHTNGRMGASTFQVLVAGAPMAVLLGGVGGCAPAPGARRALLPAVAPGSAPARHPPLLRLLRAEAVHRLHEPSAPVGAGT